MNLDSAIGSIWSESSLLRDFHAICDTGGRLAGTESEMAARRYISQRLDGMAGDRHDFSYEYTGRQPVSATCTIKNRESPIHAVGLPGSPSLAKAELEIVDLGAGVEADFASFPGGLAGKAVIVQHEYPFTLSHTHRWRKYDWARQAGAAAFVIANNIRAIGPVTGGAGRMTDDTDIPAIGVSLEDGDALREAANQGATMTLSVESEVRTWDAQNLIMDFPGQDDSYVLLCAHVDGHNLGESAMDNATGLAAVLEVARVLGPLAEQRRHGLRIAFFTVEEWGLDGSRRYVESMEQADRDRIHAAIALDSITGHARLSALTGGYARMETLVSDYSSTTGTAIDIVRPTLANSDHFNFQNNGIPAMRMIAGFGRPESLTRYLLTPADRREIVDINQLRSAISVVAGLVHAACEDPHVSLD